MGPSASAKARIVQCAGRMRRAARDPAFLLALGAAPLSWAALDAWLLPYAPQPGRFWSDPAAVLLGVVLYPLVEEWLFRGRLQPAIAATRLGRARRIGISAANLLTSVAFATVHLLAHSPVWALLVVFPSLAFGFFRDRYSAIGPSIALHVFYNAGFFTLFSPGT